jgi:hypothetical protein
LHALQNQKMVLSTLIILLVLSFYSTQATTTLNQEQMIDFVNHTHSYTPSDHFDPTQLGTQIGWGLYTPAVISTMAFNASAVPPILGRAQRFKTLLWGSVEEKNQLLLQLFCEDTIGKTKQMDEGAFIHFLQDLKTDTEMPKKALKEVYQLLLGVKKPQELFPGRKFGEDSLSYMVSRLHGKWTKKPDWIFFKPAPPNDTAPLLNKSGQQSRSVPAETYAYSTVV